MGSTVGPASAVGGKMARYEPGGTMRVAWPSLSVSGELASGVLALNLSSERYTSTVAPMTGVLSWKSCTVSASGVTAPGAAGSMWVPRQPRLAGFLVVGSVVLD